MVNTRRNKYQPEPIAHSERESKEKRPPRTIEQWRVSKQDRNREGKRGRDEESCNEDTPALKRGRAAVASQAPENPADHGTDTQASHQQGTRSSSSRSAPSQTPSSPTPSASRPRSSSHSSRVKSRAPARGTAVDDQEVTSTRRAEIASTLHHLLSRLRCNPTSSTICPSQIPRRLHNFNPERYPDWRSMMDEVREAVWDEVREGRVEVTQGGDKRDWEMREELKGPIRVRRGEKWVAPSQAGERKG